MWPLWGMKSDPVTDSAVLPILHLNGYKIANPTILARMPEDELLGLLIGYGYKPYLVAGDEPDSMHQKMAATFDRAFDEVHAIQQAARRGTQHHRPVWPMIVLKTPKGWTGPKEVDGLKTEGFWRAHQVPFAGMATKPEHVKLLESWMKSYRPDELFTEKGALRPEIGALAPADERRMSANPHANGGALKRDLQLPEIAAYAVAVETPGAHDAEATAVMAEYLRDVMKGSAERRNFRVFGPDETASNRLSHLFEATDRAWNAMTFPMTTISRRTGGSWKSSPSIPVRVGWKVI
jgi:xylulose-5-phosphate/fructose-6-phosphate phosphoketolase